MTTIEVIIDDLVYHSHTVFSACRSITGMYIGVVGQAVDSSQTTEAIDSYSGTGKVQACSTSCHIIQSTINQP